MYICIHIYIYIIHYTHLISIMIINIMIIIMNISYIL